MAGSTVPLAVLKRHGERCGYLPATKGENKPGVGRTMFKRICAFVSNLSMQSVSFHFPILNAGILKKQERVDSDNASPSGRRDKPAVDNEEFDGYNARTYVASVYTSIVARTL